MNDDFAPKFKEGQKVTVKNYCGVLILDSIELFQDNIN